MVKMEAGKGNLRMKSTLLKIWIEFEILNCSSLFYSNSSDMRFCIFF